MFLHNCHVSLGNISRIWTPKRIEMEIIYSLHHDWLLAADYNNSRPNTKFFQHKHLLVSSCHLALLQAHVGPDSVLLPTTSIGMEG